MERAQPHSLDAERATLGAVIIDNDAYPVAASIVTTEMFYRRGHQLVWRHTVKLAEARQPVDLVSLKESLERASELEDVGGPVYLAGLTDGVPRATNVAYYATVVREKWQLRQLIQSASRVVSSAYDAADDAAAILDEAERSVMAISRTTASGGFVLVDEWARELYGQIEEAQQNKRVVTGVPTGFPTLDRMTRGFQPGDLIFIAALPSVGKTSVTMQMAAHAAEHVMAGVVSLEMNRRDVGFRLVATEARVDLYGLQTGFLSSADYQRVGEALNRISNKRLAIDDASGLTDMELRARVRRFASRHGLGIVFVDYLQLLSSHGKVENRNLEVGAMARGLKALAKDLRVPMVLLSQLSRDSAKANRRPSKHDLRDSGELEQHADVVILLHRVKQIEDGQSAKYQDGELVELIVDKQRNGPLGIIPLQWIGSQVRFVEQA